MSDNESTWTLDTVEHYGTEITLRSDDRHIVAQVYRIDNEHVRIHVEPEPGVRAEHRATCVYYARAEACRLTAQLFDAAGDLAGEPTGALEIDVAPLNMLLGGGFEVRGRDAIFAIVPLFANLDGDFVLENVIPPNTWQVRAAQAALENVKEKP